MSAEADIKGSHLRRTVLFSVLVIVAGACSALGFWQLRRLGERRSVNALGIAGSMASGIIEYLAEGAWTKRLHPGWAAQGGYRAAMLARSGFIGPRSVLEGKHGLFNGFARTVDGDWEALLGGFGERWVAETIAFKPYACGTMMQPYIDCALKLRARGIAPEANSGIVCETAEGFVHRLWEPLRPRATSGVWSRCSTALIARPRRRPSASLTTPTAHASWRSAARLSRCRRTIRCRTSSAPGR